MAWTPARLERLFRPRSIALVGASERSNWARMIISTLERTGYTGRIELVNGRGGKVFGREAVASLTDLAEPVDAAYVMVPSHLVLPSVQDGRDAGVRNFVVLSSGFAEAGEEGRVAQQQLRELAIDGELAIIGPNTMGFINVTDGITLMPNSLSGLPPRGNVGLVTQSGALAGATLRYCEAQGIGLSKVIALGNEVVIGVAEVIDYLIDDPHTSAIAVMMEAIRSPELFRQVAARAVAAGIPIVALKAGRTEAGARVGAAHTGAMVDDDRVVDAIFRQLGVVRVRSLEALVTTASVLARTGRALSGNRVVVLGISGGACNIIADRAEDEGLRLEPFNTRTATELEALVSSYGVINNPLDVTGAAVNDPELFGNLIRVVTRHADADVLVVQHDIPGPNTSAVQTFTNVLRAAAQSERVPTLVVGALGQSAPLDGEWSSTEGVERIVACGMDLAIFAVGRAAWWSQRHRLGIRRTARTEEATIPEHTPGEIWSEERARALLADAGFPLVPAEVAATLDEAIAGAERFGFPVALKAIIPSVAHKSDIGAVELGVTDAEDLHAAGKRITERLAAAGHQAERFLVSPMRPRGVELIAGVVRDPAWGSVLALGFGGTWAEVLGDTALRVLPIDERDLRDMLAELRGASLLTAPRGLPPVDLDAVVAAVVALARLAVSLGDDLESIEVNPLWVRGSQVEGLDALVSWRAGSPQREGMDSDD
jgi:acetate---CoA ligase (ADP-forming)